MVIDSEFWKWSTDWKAIDGETWAISRTGKWCRLNSAWRVQLQFKSGWSSLPRQQAIGKSRLSNPRTGQEASGATPAVQKCSGQARDSTGEQREGTESSQGWDESTPCKHAPIDSTPHPGDPLFSWQSMFWRRRFRSKRGRSNCRAPFERTIFQRWHSWKKSVPLY